MGKFEQMHEDAQFAKDFPYGVPGKTWCTKDGKEIEVAKMTEAHIKNCMRMIGPKDPWFDYFATELKRRIDQNNSVNCELVEKYEKNLLKYWEDGHGDMIVLISEMQGFLDCLMMQKIIKEDYYSEIIDSFREKLKAIRKG